MESQKMKNYEVSPIEILHAFKGHIHNLWDALPDLLNDQMKQKLKSVLEACYDSKGKVSNLLKNC